MRQCRSIMETCKDTGWSWVVLFGVFMAYTLSFGFLQCIGVFLVDWQEDFEITTQAASWSTAISIAGFGISGISLYSDSLYMKIIFFFLERLKCTTTNRKILAFLKLRLKQL